MARPKILREPMCFAQLFCLIVVIVCLSIVAWAIWFLTRHSEVLKDPTSVAVLMVLLGVIKMAADAVVKYITASSFSSQAKDEAAVKSNDRMIDAVANSVPVIKSVA